MKCRYISNTIMVMLHDLFLFDMNTGILPCVGFGKRTSLLMNLFLGHCTMKEGIYCYVKALSFPWHNSLIACSSAGCLSLHPRLTNMLARCPQTDAAHTPNPPRHTPNFSRLNRLSRASQQVFLTCRTPLACTE